ncbi:MFS transporter [Bifidobacterium oedipodis]|uniref:Transporter, major facilitator family protein n=1 Tax=Bifidobacterium oedipodis TaxID=2675322 RepID=A0A7Y0EQU4_9BIFI|nr:MFS transporter [Bifidobacterium sp. DSM 109957]NMM94737.1 Transporter, major facilitator family protein [Bifidobacterium sp. DSM 109957]
MSCASVRPTYANLLRTTDYGWWLGADTFGALSESIATFALPLIALSATGSPAIAAFVQAAGVAVQTVVGLAGGLLQDRCDRKLLMALWGGTGLTLFALAALMQHLGWLTAPTIVALALLMGVRGGLLQDASNTMLRGLVPDSALPKVLSMNDARDNTVSLLSGPISGLMMTISNACPLLASAVLSLMGMVSTAPIHRYWQRTDTHRTDSQRKASHPSNDDAANHTSTDAPAAAQTSAWKDAFSGLTWLLTNRFQRRLLLISAALVGASNAFLLVTVMHISASGTATVSAGLLNMVSAASMIVGALIAPTLIDRVPGGILIGVMFVAMGIGFTGAAFTPDASGKAAFVALAVVALPAANAVLGGFTTALVSEGNQGRVGAGSGLVQYGAYALFAAGSGSCMQLWGYAPTCVGLAATIALAAIAAITMRSLITLPTPQHWEEHIERWHLERH